jgi:FkbM family methyltransferase
MIASGCETFLRTYYNENFYDFQSNGEQFAMRRAADYLGAGAVVIWDVGAHDGEWALMAREIFPAAAIHCFEIVPLVAERLAATMAGDQALTVHALGLSDATGERTVHLNAAFETTTSLSPRHGHELFHAGTSEVPCRCVTGDLMARDTPPPTILKLDVEGHEVAVLRGAKQVLTSPGAPAMIQIEYGDTYLPSHNTLKDVYEAVEAGGYHIGRLYPNHVDFKPYEYQDDNFRMGNLIAVRDGRLRAMLS